MYPQFDKADSILRKAADHGRFFLYEFEVYSLLAAIGIPTSRFTIVKSPDGPFDKAGNLGSDRLVLKIVHPHIVHKSDVGGVAFVSAGEVESGIRRMFAVVPKRQADIYLTRHEIPADYKHLSPEEFTSAFIADTVGVQVSTMIPAEPGFGSELFIGMRSTREFGPVINAGLGGLDTELYARDLRKGRAGITISPGVSDEAEFFSAFRETIAYETLTGKARGHEKLVDDDVIVDLLERFHALIWRYSPFNPDALYHLSECEINPFIASDGKLIPVDGLLRFGDVKAVKSPSPVHKIENLLRPKNICVIGVSGKSMNLGRVILRNLLKDEFAHGQLAIVKPGDDEIDGVKCYPSIADLPSTFDLIVLAVAAGQVNEIISGIVDNDKARSIILITGGMGEKEGSENLEEELKRIIEGSRSRDDRGPVMVGGNSLGIISRPGGYDTMFLPPSKLPKDPDIPLGNKVAFISQSGAFMVSRMSKLDGMLPRYAVSTGNQVDLGVSDFVEHLISDSDLKVFGCYGEGFGWLEGLHLAQSARKIVAGGRDVIVYKAGRSAEGRKAASSHTAAIAGDWDVADAILSRSGCIVARSFEEWQNLIILAGMLSDRPVGLGRIGAISNAGFETVGMADNLEGEHHRLEFAEFTDETKTRLAEILARFRLDELVNIKNPMDINPMAVDRAHVELAKAFNDDPNVDVIIHGCVPLSPQMKTREPGGPEGDGIADPESFTQLLIGAFRNEITKPIVVVLDAGSLYDPMEKMFLDAGIPVFRSADEAIKAVGRWMQK